MEPNRCRCRVVQIVIWAVAIELVGMTWGYALMACDRAHGYLRAVGIGALISVVLNVSLIPKLGLMGAGLARLTSSVAIAVYFWFQFRQVLRLYLFRYLLKPVLREHVDALGICFHGVFVGATYDRWRARLLWQKYL